MMRVYPLVFCFFFLEGLLLVEGFFAGLQRAVLQNDV